MKQGKSEIGAALRGPGSDEVRSRLVNVLNGNIPLDVDFYDGLAEASTDVITVTAVYKHMGAKSKPSSSMTSEVKYRAGSMFGVLRKSRRKVFANKHLSVEARILYVRSLLFSRLFFRSRHVAHTYHGCHAHNP